MKRLAMIAFVVLAACNKPSEDSCRKALQNMQKLLGTATASADASALDGEVRRCRGGSSKESVECAISAKTEEELKGCNFYGDKK